MASVVAPEVAVADQLSVDGLYRAPVSNTVESSAPPQTTMTLPVHTAVWRYLAAGAPVGETDVHTLFSGSYRAPVPSAGFLGFDSGQAPR